MEKIEQQIEKLAASVAKGFERVEQRFDAVDRRFDGVDRRFEKLEGELGELKSEVHLGFRDVRHDIKELRDTSIPLPEQEELWKRLDRIEKHLGLSPELA